MASIKQFEKALTEIGVTIELIKSGRLGVIKAMGIKDGKRYTWLAEGYCFRFHKRVQELDINDKL